MNLRVGTRGSRLALAQTRLATAALGEVEIVVVRTAGDDTTASLRTLGDGVFVGALEVALRRGEIDVAVHSLKDLPTEEQADLVIAAIPERGDPRDVVITRDRTGLAGLSAGAVVGTSSVRRGAFLLALRPDLEIREIRGNVETRMAKVEQGAYDAAILARAGLDRVGIVVHEVESLTLEDCPPAPGQAALALQCRADDAATRALLASLDHAATRAAVTAERLLLKALGASCEIPLGALGSVIAEGVRLDAALATVSGLRRTSVVAATAEQAAARAAAALGAFVHA